MDMQRQEKEVLWDLVKVKGRDFDLDGGETPKEELRRMSGFFKLMDVQERIPFELKRLKYWYSTRNSPFHRFFVKVPMGEKRSLVFVDLERLSAELQARWEGSLRS